MDIGNDCWNIINDYKNQLEHIDKFKPNLLYIQSRQKYCKNCFVNLKDTENTSYYYRNKLFCCTICGFQNHVNDLSVEIDNLRQDLYLIRIDMMGI